MSAWPAEYIIWDARTGLVLGENHEPDGPPMTLEAACDRALLLNSFVLPIEEYPYHVFPAFMRRVLTGKRMDQLPQWEQKTKKETP